MIVNDTKMVNCVIGQRYLLPWRETFWYPAVGNTDAIA